MIDLQTQIALRNLITEYVWALDMGDLDRTCRVFTPGAVMRDTAGNRYEGVDKIRGYFGYLTALPEFRGRQHHIDNLLLAQEGEGVRCRSYWTVTQWLTRQGRKDVVSLGHASDLFVREGGAWRFAERLLYHWKDADCPWQPDGTAV